MDGELLRRDLSPFCDPATELAITQGAAGIRVQLVRNGVDHDYFFNSTDGSIIARHVKGGRKIASLRSLIASAEFADVRAYAHTQSRMYKEFDVEALIPAEGEIQFERLTTQTLSRALSPPKPLAEANGEGIRIALIDGPAGVGKTSLIESILVQRARRQKDASALPPILHVTSRGRRLVGLDDALAQSIDLMRAKFTFDQTPVLIRYNLLQIAIDGFDELVDPEGYKDAWFALRDFFSDVVVGGPVILAGRDTFFDQQSFMKELAVAPFKSELTHIRLKPVSPSKARDWLRQRGWTYEDVRSPLSRIIFRAGSYALRPFFLSQLADARSWKNLEATDLTPRAFLVDKFVNREARLLSEQLSIPEAQVRDRLSNLFEEIALEMADSEVDAVDLAFLQLVTEVAFGDVLASHDLAKLQHKAGSFALLETDARDGYRRFPHTEISNHFLAASLIRTIGSGTFTRFLRRGTPTADLLTIFGEILVRHEEESIVALVKNLRKVLVEESSFDRLPENAGSLLVSSLSSSYARNLRDIDDLSVLHAVIFGTVAPARLQKVRIQHLNAKEADLTSVDFEECEVVNLTVDETTVFGHSRPHVHHLLIGTANGSVTEVLEPTGIDEWISAHSDKEDLDEGNTEATRLLDKVCRVMLRQHMIKEHPDDRAGRLLNARYWDSIEAILVRTGWLDRIDSKATSGAPASFVRMRDPYVLLTSQSQKVNSIWAQVAKLPV